MRTVRGFWSFEPFGTFGLFQESLGYFLVDCFGYVFWIHRIFQKRAEDFIKWVTPQWTTLPRVGFFGATQRWGGQFDLPPPLIWPRRGQIFKNVNIILLYNVINRFRPKKSGKSNLRPLYSTFLLFRDLYGKICRFWRHFWRPQKWSEKRCLGGFFAANVLIGVQRTL